MYRWLLFALAAALLLLGSLTVVVCPDRIPWRLAVLAGEYGCWLALVPLTIAALAWTARRSGMALATATVLLSAVAIGLMLKPCVEAWQIGETLPAKLAAEFGPHVPARPPFSVRSLFARGPAAVQPRELEFSAGLFLDFYAPPERKAAAVPCVIVVHGGGWDGGDRGEIVQLDHWLASKGFAVAAISYRLAPQFPWPAQRDDVLAAIAYLKSHGPELGLDPSRLVLLGRSAGGQLAEVVGYTAQDPAIRGIVALYAPSDMVFAYAHAREDDALKSPHLMRQFLGGTPETALAAYDEASALAHVTHASPPTLLLHGQLDTLVWHRHSERLDARLAEAQVPHAFISLPWATHAFEYHLTGPGGQLTTYALEWFLASVTAPAIAVER
jgi:acetyl esterase/lipase